jgi:hypothetical protein
MKEFHPKRQRPRHGYWTLNLEVLAPKMDSRDDRHPANPAIGKRLCGGR